MNKTATELNTAKVITLITSEVLREKLVAAQLAKKKKLPPFIEPEDRCS
jgi:hypothetical protein